MTISFVPLIYFPPVMIRQLNRSTILRQIGRCCLTLGIFGLLWQIAASLLPSLLLPLPQTVGIRLWQLLLAGRWLPHWLATIERLALCLGTIVGIGFPLGVLFGSIGFLRRLVQLPLDLLRSLPATAMFPLFLILFGIGSPAIVAMSAFVGLGIMIFSILQAIIQIPRLRYRMAQLFGASYWQCLRQVVWWEILPVLLINLRIVISLALTVLVVAEMVVGISFGLGQALYTAYLTYDLPELYAWLLIVGLTGYILNLLPAWAGAWLCPWVFFAPPNR